MGDHRTLSCYDDGKALDSCLLQRAQAANVGAVFNLPLPLPDALLVGEERVRSRRRIFKPVFREDICKNNRHIWPNLANETNCFYKRF